MENGRRCEIFKTDVHRASYAKHWRSKKHLENEKQNDCLYQSGNSKKLLKIELKIYIIVNQ